MKRAQPESHGLTASHASSVGHAIRAALAAEDEFVSELDSTIASTSLPSVSAHLLDMNGESVLAVAQHESAPAEPTDARPLDAADPMVILAYRHFREQRTVLEAQLSRAGAGGSPEGVHQARVAIRRVRAALKAFARILPVEPQRRFRQEFRWLAGVLGQVRDLDVQRERVVGAVASLPAETRTALGPYQEHLRREQAAAREEMLHMLDGPRCARLVADFAAFIDGEPSPAALRRWGSFRIAEGAPQYIGDAVKKVTRRARHIDPSAARDELHELRIRCKRLRYLIELFVPVYGKRLGRKAKIVRRLQDILGEHQDAGVTADRLRAYASSLPAGPDYAPQLLAIGQLLHVESETAESARTRFEAAWDQLKPKLARRKLRRALEARVSP